VTLRLALWLACGIAAVTLAFGLSCLVGAQEISIAAALSSAEPDRTILFGLRIPRIVAGALVGCALGISGAALQGLLRNALAEPFVLGVSGGAALGGAVVMVAAAATERMGGGTLLAAPIPVTLGAAAGAAGATLLAIWLGRSGGILVPTSALLVGVVFNFFAAAAITVLKLLVRPEEASRLLYWLAGSLGPESQSALTTGAVAILIATATLVAMGSPLNLLALGDDEASTLGVEVGRARTLIFLAASLATGAAVSLAGMVGFVGLIIPHAIRLVAGPDHRLLLPASALFGAAFLVLADTGARLAFGPLGTEPPVGALTAVLGGPLFLWLLRRPAGVGGDWTAASKHR
jgi:iron complex transport system permease protein